MENSFYYFFSATPQVLAGVLALFGVFIIFKIQNKTTELLSIASELKQYIFTYSDANDTNESRTARAIFYSEIDWNIQNKKIIALERMLREDAEALVKHSERYLVLNATWDIAYLGLIINKKLTIYSSIITAVVIIVCLAIIPFGKLLISHTILLFFIFSIIILCTAVIFYILITILKWAIE
jgi:hypothetical protein